MLTIWVRVNMKGVIDAGLNGWTAADVDSVGIMGGFPTGSTAADWGSPFYLKQEAVPTNGSSQFGIPANTFYSGALRIPKSKVTAGQDIAYKFRLGSGWNLGSFSRGENLSDPPYPGTNRHLKIPVGLKDTTLHWVYFSDVKPIARANPDSIIATFRADMSAAIAGGGFVNGDTLQVQVGWFSTADSVRTLSITLGGTMKKVILLAFVLLVAVAFVMPQANAQTTHNVTFIVNTATVPDTITSKSPVRRSTRR